MHRYLGLTGNQAVFKDTEGGGGVLLRGVREINDIDPEGLDEGVSGSTCSVYNFGRGLAQFEALTYFDFGGCFEAVETAEALEADAVAGGYLAEAVTATHGVGGCALAAR